MMVVDSDVLIAHLRGCGCPMSTNASPGAPVSSCASSGGHTAASACDYLIAATVTVHGLSLATLNVRHYPMIPDLAAAFSLA
ncbi:MAG: hypothetical protein ACR2MA_07980 [Egibacteraceae bacterium]